MKYCVFAFKKEFPRIAKAKNNLSPDPFSLERSCAAYEAAVSSKIFKEVYFLIDFGHDEVPFWRAVDVDYFKGSTIPWILISMYRSSNEELFTNPMISKLVLELKGFREEFQNVYKGIKRFNYYLDSQIKCTMLVDIFGSTERFVTSTSMEIHRKNDPKFYCRKYRI